MRGMLPSASRVLRDLDPLPVPRRAAHIAALGRQFAGDPHLPALLDDLAGRGRFERRLAVALAAAARDLRFLEGALTDPDLGVRAAALGTARHLPLADAALSRLLADSPAALRRQIYRVVKASGRTAAADGLLDEVRLRYGDGEAASLLPACSGELIAVRLPLLAYAVRNWVALGRRHPGAVLDLLERELPRLPAPLRDARWNECSGGLAAAVRPFPARVLGLLKHYGPQGSLPAGVSRLLPGLLAADPAGAVGLLTETGWPLPHHRVTDAAARSATAEATATGSATSTASATGAATAEAAADRQPARYGRVLRRALRELPAEHLDRLAAAVRDRPGELAALLAALPVSRREEAYDQAMAGTDQARALLPEVLLRVLPQRRAITEARRMLALATASADPALALRVHAHLPLAEAAGELLRATQQPSARDRAVGYSLLVDCAARTGDPAAFGATLAGLHRLGDDHDAVRHAAVLAVDRAPLSLFTTELVPTLQRFVTTIMQAPDCSARTRHAVVALVARAVRDDPRAYRIIQPRVDAEQDRGRYDLAVAVAWALGGRAEQPAELRAALGRATTAADARTVRAAVPLWLAAARTRDERVEHLVRQDPSTALLPAVLSVLATRRTDLLDSALLGETAPVGRFARAGARPVPLVGRALRGWLPRQAAAYARLLAEAAGDSTRHLSARTAALRVLGTVPAFGAQAVRPFLRSGESPVVLAALAALAGGDRPDLALPALLAWMESGQAGAAGPAVARCARYVPPSRLPVVLGPLAASTRVSARRQAALLHGALRAPGAVSALVSAWQRPGEHRDVRIAVITGMLHLLDDDRAWAILDEAASGPQDLALSLLPGDPLGLPARHRDRYAELVRRLCGAADPRVRAAALTAAPSWAGWSPELAPDLGRRVVDLADTRTWAPAAEALAVSAAGGTGRSAFVAALRGLLLADARPDTLDVAAGRDRPARQRVAALVDGLIRHSVRSEPVDSVLASAADTLATDPSFLPLAVRLAVHRLPAAPPGRPLRQLDRIADVLAGWPVAAALAAADLAGRLARTGSRWEPGDVRDDVVRLTDRGDLAGGLLAVVVAGAAGRRLGWPEPWQEVLGALRHHREPEVRHAALALFSTAD